MLQDSWEEDTHISGFKSKAVTLESNALIPLSRHILACSVSWESQAMACMEVETLSDCCTGVRAGERSSSLLKFLSKSANAGVPELQMSGKL